MQAQCDAFLYNTSIYPGSGAAAAATSIQPLFFYTRGIHKPPAFHAFGIFHLQTFLSVGSNHDGHASESAYCLGFITIWSGCRVSNFILDSYSPFVMIRSSSKIRCKARLLWELVPLNKH